MKVVPLAECAARVVGLENLDELLTKSESKDGSAKRGRRGIGEEKEGQRGSGRHGMAGGEGGVRGRRVPAAR